MKPKNGLVNFLRKQEGKPPLSKNFKRIPFPEVDDYDMFVQLCEVVYNRLPGEYLDEDQRYWVDFGFTWDTGPIEWTLWKGMHGTGYIHPECYDCLYAWHKMLQNGEEPENVEDDLF
jgi:hypothetical protein